MRQKHSVIIKQKADFIYNNSGILVYKLENEATKDETINELTIILLSSLPLENSELNNMATDLTNSSSLRRNNYDNNYHNAIKVIFTLCLYINKHITDDNQRATLLDIIRKYPQKFESIQYEDLEKNGELIKYDEIGYQKIKEKYEKRT